MVFKLYHIIWKHFEIYGEFWKHFETHNLKTLWNLWGNFENILKHIIWKPLKPMGNFENTLKHILKTLLSTSFENTLKSMGNFENTLKHII